MSVNEKIIRISEAFAEACADCESLRVSDPYPQEKWRAAWERRMRLSREWQEVAKTLTDRPTEPQS